MSTKNLSSWPGVTTPGSSQPLHGSEINLRRISGARRARRSMDPRVSWRSFWIGILGIWAVVGYSRPKLIPALIVVGIGLLLCLFAFLCGARLHIIPVLPVGFSILALVSAILSPFAPDSREAGFLLIVTLSALVFSNNIDPVSALTSLCRGFDAILVLSVLLLFVAPTIALDWRYPNAGTLIGPYVQKNILGAVLAVGTIITLYYYAIRRSLLWLLPRMALYGWLLALTKSAAAAVGASISVILYFCFRGVHRSSSPSRHWALRLVPLTFLTILPLAYIWRWKVLAALGKDPSLSGRSRIWEGSFVAWRERPWFGYGWGGAFSGNDEASAIIATFTGWDVPSSHSGYITILLDLGIVGLIAFSAYCMLLILKYWKQIHCIGSVGSLWVSQFLLLFVGLNFFDTWVSNMYWFIAVCAGVWFREPSHSSADVEFTAGEISSRPLSSAAHRRYPPMP